MEKAIQLRETRRISWNTLLRLCIGCDLVVLLYMVITSGDTLALGLAVVFLIGLGLMRFRGGLTGIVLTGILCTDISLWTVSGAVNNFANGEGIWALLLPAYLGVISLTGVTAAAGSLVTRKDPSNASRKAVILGQTAVALLVVITAAGLLVRTRAVIADQPNEIVLSTKGMKYSNSELSSDGGEVTLRLSNEDLWWHTFTIEELDLNLAVPMGAERSMTFTAPPGSYDFYCSIPGHEAAGMRGTIVVGE